MQTDDAQSLKVQLLFLFLITSIDPYIYRYSWHRYRYELLLGLKFHTEFIGTEVSCFVYSGCGWKPAVFSKSDTMILFWSKRWFNTYWLISILLVNRIELVNTLRACLQWYCVREEHYYSFVLLGDDFSCPRGHSPSFQCWQVSWSPSITPISSGMWENVLLSLAQKGTFCYCGLKNK